MSARLNWKLAIRDSRLDSTAKLIAFTLETWMNADGANAYPSRATIASGAGVTVRTVEKALDRLEVAGYLDIARSKGRTVNRYRATDPHANSEPASPFSTSADLHNSESPSPSTANLTHATANLATPNGESPSPELELNPSLNPSPEPEPVSASNTIDLKDFAHHGLKEVAL